MIHCSPGHDQWSYELQSKISKSGVFQQVATQWRGLCISKSSTCVAWMPSELVTGNYKQTSCQQWYVKMIEHTCMYIYILWFNNYIIYINYRISHNTSSFSDIMRTIMISNSLDIKVWTSFPAASPTTLLYPFLLPSTGVLTGHSQCCRFHQHMFAQLDIDLMLQVSTRSHPTNMWW